MVIEKYLLRGWARGILGLFIKNCLCVCTVGWVAVWLLGWGVSEFHWIRGNVKVGFYLGTEGM